MPPGDLPSGPYVTVTLHRRENWPRLAAVAEALASLARDHPDSTFVFPVHLNPIVREAADFARHRRVARLTLPVWLYVSATGVAIYLMLYWVYPSG